MEGPPRDEEKIDKDDGSPLDTLIEMRVDMHRKWSEDYPNGPSFRPHCPWESTTLSENISNIYKADKLVGKGLTGRVYSAWVKNYPDSLYAIKSVNKNKFSQKGLEYLKEEIEVLKILDHPNVCTFFECYEDNTSINIVMELCKGEDLATMVEKHRRLDDRTAKTIFHQCLLALNYLHSIGYAHRDVKLDNFMVERVGTQGNDDYIVKLIDFGFSKNYRKNKLTSMVGSPWYISPEQLSPTSRSDGYTQACDAWALGVLLYIMLTGKPPFNAPSREGIFQQIQTVDVRYDTPLFDNIDRDCVDIMRGLLCRDWRERMSVQGALQSRWFHDRIENNIDNITIRKTLDRLSTPIGQFSPLREYVHRTMVKMYPREPAIIQGTRLFYTLDYINNGILTRTEIDHLSQSVGMDAGKVWKSIQDRLQMDASCDYIPYSSFLSCVIEEGFFTEDNRLVRIFNRLDTDSTGFISEENIESCFQRFGYSLSENTVKQLIADFDIYKDGVISYEEFIKVMKKD